MTAKTSPRHRQRAPPTRKRGTSGSPARRWLVLGLLAFGVLVAAVVVLRGVRTSDGALATLTTDDFHALAFSPNDPNVVFFGHHNGVLRSTDGGRNWSPLVARQNFDAMGLAVSRANANRLYLAGHNLFQVSDDGGKTWQPVAHDLPGADIHGFTISPDDPNRLTALVVGQGIFQSTDGGRSWQRLPGQVPADVMALASAGGSPETLYAGSMSAGVLRSSDGGQTWTPAVTGLESRAIYALAVAPASRATVYAGTGSGLFQSTDGGGAWRKLPFPANNTVALAISPAQPGRVLAIAVVSQQGRVYRSDNGGRAGPAGSPARPGYAGSCTGSGVPRNCSRVFPSA